MTHLTSLQFNRVFTTDIRKHISVVFAGAFVGYITGIVLNALTATVQFPYIGALCLCGASWISALGTWLLSDFCDDAPLAEPGAPEDLTNWKVYSQKLIGFGDARPAVITGHSEDLPRLVGGIGGIKFSHNDGTNISTGIDRTLAKASQNSAHAVAGALSKGREVLPKTISQWQAGHSEITMVRQEAFAKLGIGDRFAVGFSEDGCLKIFLGMPALRGQSNDFAISEEGTLVEM